MEAWFSDPSKVGATVLLLAAVYAFAKGLVVPRWTFDAAAAQAEKELQRAIADCQLHKDMNLRLLGQMERSVSAAEVTATAAAKVVAEKR